mmetsp:Transcript_14084/g.20118  ORF Transcript_14084/g.20118 Transcript_14084/m.20118 type:complete len:238 (+) Transcript_14084:89-802(+)
MRNFSRNYFIAIMVVSICIQNLSIMELHAHQMTSSRNRQEKFRQPVLQSNPPRTCRIFIWDIPSAIKLHLCERLLRGNIYEGIGGKRFVKIKPNSILESLYPPSKHSVDRCIFCGSSFKDHMDCWWSEHAKGPYGLHLDKTKHDAESVAYDNLQEGCVRYYHLPYFKLENASKNNLPSKRRKNLSELKKSGFDSNTRERYIDDLNIKSTSNGLLTCIRVIVLQKLDSFISIQFKENR